MILLSLPFVWVFFYFFFFFFFWGGREDVVGWEGRRGMGEQRGLLKTDGVDIFSFHFWCGLMNFICVDDMNVPESVLFVLCVCRRPDMTFAVDWALNNTYLSVLSGTPLRHSSRDHHTGVLWTEIGLRSTAVGYCGCRH